MVVSDAIEQTLARQEGRMSPEERAREIALTIPCSTKAVRVTEEALMNIGQLQREFLQRANTAGLKVQCMGDGDADAAIAIVGEAPGEQECRLRTPLVGGSGKFLWDALRRFGLQRRQCYVTNVIKRQLVSEGERKEKVPANELAHWHGLLEWELNTLPNVKYVLILGNMALEALSGRSGVEDWRGSVLPINGRTYVVTVNPAHILRTPSLEAWFLLDLAKLDMVIRGTFREHAIVPHIDPSPSECLRHIGRMFDERKPVAFDIETIAGETACVGLANDIHEGMCINFRDAGRNRYSVREESTIRRQLQRLFDADETRLVAQNGNFDSYWLAYKDRLQVRRVWFDTLLAHHLLYPSAPHDLGFLTTQYTTHPYYKNERVLWRESSTGKIEDFWVYNVKDCCITLAVSEQLHRELKHEGLDTFFFNHVMRVQPHLTQMTICGVKVDDVRRREFDEQYAQLVDELERKVVDAARVATGDPSLVVNPRSRVQMHDVLFNKLRLIGRGQSTDKTNRKHILAHPKTRDVDKTLILTYDRYQKEYKFWSSSVKMKIDDDGRARTEFKQFGTQSAPGRLSSSGNMWGSGTNLQNRPPLARTMYIADRDGLNDYTFVYYDLSQAEARMVAWLANIKTWKEQFERARFDGKYDCHRALAAEMFKVPYDQVPVKDTDANGYTIRYIAKRCRHGLNYRMGPDRLAEVTGLPYDEAVRAYNLYHNLTPELRAWWRSLEEDVRRTRKLVTPYGRVWRLMERLESDDQLEAIVAFVPQSTIGDKNTQVTYQCHEDDDWPAHATFVEGTRRRMLDARILLNVHDSNTAICKVSDVERVGRIMKKYAESPIIVRGEPLIIPAEIKWCNPATEYRTGSTVLRWSDLEPLVLT